MRSDAVAWIQSQSKSTLGRHIDNVYGSIPDVESDWIALPDGPIWLWWLTAVIPFDSVDLVSITVLTFENSIYYSVLFYFSKAQNPFDDATEESNLNDASHSAQRQVHVFLCKDCNAQRIFYLHLNYFKNYFSLNKFRVQIFLFSV